MHGVKTRVMDDIFTTMQEVIHYRFGQVKLLELALTHSSWANEQGCPNQSNERLVVAYTVRINGRDSVYASTGGTPDLQLASTDQSANLVYDPNVVPGTAAFRREIRSVYRVAGDELVRSSTKVRVISGAGEQEQSPHLSNSAM